MLANGTTKPVEAIRVGNLLMGLNSEPREVLNLCRGRDVMFEVTPTKGEPFVVNGDHILSLVRTADARKPGGEIVDVSVRDWLKWTNTRKHLYKLFRTGFELSEPKLPIDPYFLGVLLGDGYFGKKQLTVSKPDREIREACEIECTKRGLGLRTEFRSRNNPSYRFSQNGGLLRADLIGLGLDKTQSDTKFVPVSYKTASSKQRLEVLAGLMDTDGSRSRGGFDFVSKSEELAKDVVFLARSVGLAAYITPCRKGCQTGAVGDYWRVSISGDCSRIPTRIPRKKVGTRLQKKDVLRTGFTVKELGIEDFYGFTLDGDGRYLMGDFTVTHNSGKTRTGGALVTRHLEKRPVDGKVLWVAHREELVSQAYDDLTSWGLSVGVIQANPTRPVNPFRPVQIASTQTLLARGIFPDATLMVLDEYHHYASDKWEALGMEYRRRKIPLVGLTATPIRSDGRGFEGLMDALVTPITMKELIAQGFLTPYELIAPPDTLRSDQIAARPVDAYLEHANGRKTILFAGNIKAAREFADQFNAVGIPSAVIWGDMDMAARRQTLDAYKSGKLRILTNVGVLTEGFDDRPTSCVILARSIGSLSLYLQMCGRGLRVSPETGKKNAIIIDLHGTCRKDGFGEPAADREWCLEGDGVKKKTLEQPTERFCLVCKVLMDPGSGNVCDLCGIARPEAMTPEVMNVKLVKYAAKLREPEHIRRAYFEKLKAIAHAKNYSRWQPVQKFKAIYGSAPPKDWW